MMLRTRPGTLRARHWLASRDGDGLCLWSIGGQWHLPAAAEGFVNGDEIDADQSAAFGQRVLLLHEHRSESKSGW